MQLDKWGVYAALGYAKRIKTHHFGTLEYPVPVVRQFHNSTARVRVSLAPARTSKSYSAGWDLVPDILAPIVNPDLPPKKHLIVGPDYDKAAKEFGYVADALVHNRHKFKLSYGVDLPEPSEFSFRPAQGKMVIKWPWGQELHAKSAMKFQSLISDQWGTCILSETAEMDEMVFFRGLRTRCERFIWPTTPGIKGMWIKEFCEKALSEGDDSVQTFQYPPEANPEYDMDRFKEALRQSGPDDPFFKEQFLGQWVFYGGRVYPQFQPDPVEDVSDRVDEKGIHGGEGAVCVEPFEIPRSWRRMAGMDFGWNDATTHLWAACAPDGTVVIYDEYYESKRGSRAHVESIKEMSVLNQTPDWQTMDRVREPHGQAKQISEDMLMEYDFFSRPVDAGDRFSRRVQIQDYMDRKPPSGLPRLRIVKDRCPNLVRELINLHYDREKIHREGSTEHYLGDDHAVDPLGYILSTRPRVSIKGDPIANYWSLDVLKRNHRKMRRLKKMIGHDRRNQPYG